MPRQARHLLTATKVRNLIRTGKPIAISDGAGLTLTISSAGYATWVLRYRINGQRKEITIGPESDYCLAEARTEAKELRRRVADGEDVSKSKRMRKTRRTTDGDPQTFSELAGVWFKRTRAPHLRHPDAVWRVFRKWINPRIGYLSIEEIRGGDIVACLEAIKAGGAPTVMNDARRFINSVLAYGVSLGCLQANVASGISATQAGVPESHRDRVLSLTEIDNLLRCMEAEREWFGRDNELCVRLLLLLGCRKGELLAALWSEVDFERCIWTLPKKQTKTLQEIIVPLPSLPVQHLMELKLRAAGSSFVFPARRRGKRRHGHVGLDTINVALAKLPHGLPHFVVHDLRRTMRTQLSALGVRPEVAERCLNHNLRGVLKVYDQYDFLPERRDALERWAATIHELDSVGRTAVDRKNDHGAFLP